MLAMNDTLAPTNNSPFLVSQSARRFSTSTAFRRGPQVNRLTKIRHLDILPFPPLHISPVKAHMSSLQDGLSLFMGFFRCGLAYHSCRWLYASFLFATLSLSPRAKCLCLALPSTEPRGHREELLGGICWGIHTFFALTVYRCCGAQSMGL